MAEGNETPGGEPGRSASRSEGDLLAERRARRAAESGEVALTRRAEAAEATVQTLERHVASLQQRLREAEDSQRELAESLELERSAALEREHELRRVKQREYAEQQLRVEAEDMLGDFDRESRAEIERIGARLSASEGDARELAERLEGVQRQLAEAEHGSAGERAAQRRFELELQARLGELERRAGEMQLGLDRERSARDRAEQLLEGMRSGHRQLAGLLGDLRGIVERLAGGLEAERAQRSEPAATPGPEPARAPISPAPQPQPPSQPPAPPPGAAVPLALAPPGLSLEPHGVAGEARGVEMADALAAAVERLRARAEAVPEAERMAHEPPPARAAQPPHKHSMSLIKRIRIWRKQRRSR